MRGLGIGVVVADTGRIEGGLNALLARFREVEHAGFQTAWVPNIFAADALTVCALAARETERIELGTAVVPTFSRHPLYMAQQALTTQAAAGGRFVCGLGPSHRVVIEEMLGLSFAKPARHVREYLSVLKPLLEEGRVDFEGERYRVKGSVAVSGGAPAPVLIGGLGPVMRRLAGELADGTITWMTGPRTLGGTIGPDVRRAAEAAGRPAPRVVAGLPVCVTDDARGAREAAAKAFALYGQLPSYRAMLDAEGAQGPGDLLVAGSEREVEAELGRLAAEGVTDLNAAVFPHGDDPAASERRTTELLAELARR